MTNVVQTSQLYTQAFSNYFSIDIYAKTKYGVDIRPLYACILFQLYCFSGIFLVYAIITIRAYHYLMFLTYTVATISTIIYM